MRKVFELTKGTKIGKVYRNGVLQLEDVDYKINRNKIIFSSHIGRSSLFDKHGEEIITVETSNSFKVTY